MDIQVRIANLSNGGQVLVGMSPDQSLVIVLRRPLQGSDLIDGEPMPCASARVADGLLETRITLSTEEVAALCDLFPRKLSEFQFETPPIAPVVVSEELPEIAIVFRRILEHDDLKAGEPIPCAMARVADGLLETSLWLSMTAASVLKKKLSCYKIEIPDQEMVSRILHEFYRYERGYRNIHWL